jgi:hypothetical protein
MRFFVMRDFVMRDCDGSHTRGRPFPSRSGTRKLNRNRWCQRVARSCFCPDSAATENKFKSSVAGSLHPWVTTPTHRFQRWRHRHERRAFPTYHAQYKKAPVNTGAFFGQNRGAGAALIRLARSVMLMNRLASERDAKRTQSGRRILAPKVTSDASAEVSSICRSGAAW